MEIINLPRGKGKTTSLIVTSSIAHMPIVAYTKETCEYIVRQAEKMRLDIIEPININTFKNNPRYYTSTKSWNGIQGILIDDLDIVLTNIFGKPVRGVTLTSNNMKFYNDSFEW